MICKSHPQGFVVQEKQKILNVGTLFKKAMDEIHGQPFKFWDLLNIGNIQFFNEILDFVP